MEGSSVMSMEAILNPKSRYLNNPHFKAMDDIGVVMTLFGDVVTVILMVNSYVFGLYHTSPIGTMLKSAQFAVPCCLI